MSKHHNTVARTKLIEFDNHLQTLKDGEFEEAIRALLNYAETVKALKEARDGKVTDIDLEDL